MAHTNGLEPQWVLVDRAVMGTFHHVSAKHIDLYNAEFSGRHNVRPLDTGEIMGEIARGAGGKADDVRGADGIRNHRLELVECACQLVIRAYAFIIRF